MTLHDEYVQDAETLHIDQLGRVVHRQIVSPNRWGSTSRCRSCIYYSKVGHMLPMGVYHKKHCKYPKAGPVDENANCEFSIWVEVEDDTQ